MPPWLPDDADVAAQVWQVDLDDTGWDAFTHVLHGDELAKAARYHAPRLGHHARRCRAVLRLLLGRHAGLEPARVALRYGWAGKPEAAGLAWHFNVAHSDRHALVALARHPVGVDIEEAGRPGVQIGELAGLICHPAEHAVLGTLAAQERAAFLYRLWVRKEAYCKALGTGLQSDVRAICFLPMPDPAVVLVRDAARPAAAPSYVRCWDAAAGCVASLCLPVARAPAAVAPLAPRDCASQRGAAR